MTNIKRFLQDSYGGERQAEAFQEFLLNFNLDFLKGSFLSELNSEGVFTQLISLSASDKKLPHRLSRRYNGFIVIENSAAVAISNLRSSDDNQFITLRASGSTSVRVWVF